METENYIVNILGVDADYYTQDFVSYLWLISANNEYKASGIFISAIIDVRNVVCRENIGCKPGDIVQVISIVRNPIETPSREAFYNSLRNILRGVRENLGNPNMTLMIQKVDYFYFFEP